MSSKKPVPEISQAEVESEIAATTSKTLTPTEKYKIKEVVTEMTQVRDENNPLVKSIMTAVQNALFSSTSSQQTRKPAPISKQVPASFLAQDLNSPSKLEMEVDGDSENVEEEALSDEQEQDFDNFLPSGMQTKTTDEFAQLRHASDLVSGQKCLKYWIICNYAIVMHFINITSF